MRLTVLGSAGSYPAPGRACSGYLLEAAGLRVLLDCGNGSLANLWAVCDVRELDLLVLTHRHHDHVADAAALAVALRFHPAGPSRLRTLCPPDVADYLRTVQPLVDGQLGFEPVSDGGQVRLGGLTLRFAAAAHPPPTLAVRAEADGVALAYTADSGPCPALAQLARGAQLLLAEATWSTRAGLPGGLHLTGAQAGELARAAGVGQLVVTHVAHPEDPQQVAAEARAVFAGPVLLAEDRQAYPVAAGPIRPQA